MPNTSSQGSLAGGLPFSVGGLNDLGSNTGGYATPNAVGELESFGPAAQAFDFTDGFEGGHADKWSTVSIVPGARAWVWTGGRRTGKYGLTIDSQLDATSFSTFRHCFIPSSGQTYYGCWVRWEREGLVGSNAGGLRAFASDNRLITTRIADIFRENVTGNIVLRTLNGASTSIFTNTGQTAALGVWTKLELQLAYGGVGAVSTIAVLVNDVIRINASNFDLHANAANMACMQLGFEHAQDARLSYDDCFCSR